LRVATDEIMTVRIGLVPTSCHVTVRYVTLLTTYNVQYDCADRLTLNIELAVSIN